MPSNGSGSPSPFFHHASAFGIAGQINRPIQQTITTKAAISLAPSGGHGTNRVDNYGVPGVLSFSAAYVEVGGSLDTVNNGTHTTYASSVVEDLNIFNVVTADRVVSRLTIYHPASTRPLSSPPLSSPPSAPPEPSFSILGSHFDNLKIGGQAIDVPLDHQSFHDSTYSSFYAGLDGPTPANKHTLIASGIDLARLQEADHNYGIVNGIAERYQEWDPSSQPLIEGQHFWCSAANRPPSAPPPPETGDFVNFGGVICVPRFGVIYLAEVLVYHNHRHLTMIRVHLCSPAGGNIDGPGSSGGGDGMPPRP